MNDIRYQGVCIKCGAKLGDWALHVPQDKRLCWDHREHTITKDTQYFAKGVRRVQATGTRPLKIAGSGKQDVLPNAPRSF